MTKYVRSGAQLFATIALVELIRVHSRESKGLRGTAK